VLVTRRGEPLLHQAFGLANRADGVAAEPATRFGIASATKMFTAVAVARLVERGAVDFTRPLADCLPPDRRPATLSPAVTIHHLLCHTSGIADYYDEDLGAAAFADVWAALPCYRVRRPADLLPLFAGRPPAAAPGERFAYSGAGYVLLGLVVEELTALAFADAVVAEVFEPAGMASSGFFALDEVHPRVAVGYVPPAAPGRPWTTNVYSLPAVGAPDGGAFATAADLDRFLTALDAGALVAADTRRAMLARHADAGEYGYGYGFWLEPRGDGTAFGHDGEDPGASASAFRDPATAANVIVLSNVTEGASAMARALERALAGAG
jgi:CubicO group peptidase (beta-lactamase class C family)